MVEKIYKCVFCGDIVAASQRSIHQQLKHFNIDAYSASRMFDDANKCETQLKL